MGCGEYGGHQRTRQEEVSGVSVVLCSEPSLMEHSLGLDKGARLGGCWISMCSGTCLVRTSKGTQNQYLSEVLAIRVGLRT